MLIRVVQHAALFLFSASVLGAQPAPEAFVTRHATLDVAIDFAAKRLAGSMALEIENWTTTPAGRVSLLLNRLMDATRVSDAAGATLSFTQDVLRFEDQPLRQVTRIMVDLPRPVAPGARTTLRAEYGGHLVGYTEVGWLYVRDRIDTAFTVLRAEALAFPDIGGLNQAVNRRVSRDDFTYDVSVRVPAGFVVATGGKGTRTSHQDGTITWRYVSQGESPFLNVAIAPFDTLTGEGVRLFHFREDSIGARRLLANAGDAMRLLTEWFGPRQGDATLTITEIPDGWGSQAHLVGGIIQTAAAFRDSTRVGEMYHELTHLWNARDTDVPSPRWNEGLASFLQDLLYERVNGWTGRRAYEARYLAWFRDRVARDSTLRSAPFVDFGARAMTNMSYSLGAIMFATLYDLVGEKEFNRIVGGYYQRFAAGGTTRDFVTHATRVASRNLTPFFDDWMFTTRWTRLVATAGSVRDLAAHYGGDATR